MIELVVSIVFVSIILITILTCITVLYWDNIRLCFPAAPNSLRSIEKDNRKINKSLQLEKRKTKAIDDRQDLLDQLDNVRQKRQDDLQHRIAQLEQSNNQ